MTIFIEKNQALLAKISNNTFKEESLKLIGEEITDLDIPVLISALEKNTQICRINLLANSITDIGASQLALFCANTKGRIKELNLAENLIEEEGAKALATSGCETLFLNDNNIGDEGLLAFLNSKNLNALYVNNCNISNISASQILSKSLLKILGIGENPLITTEALKNIDENNTLTELDFKKNVIDSLGAQYLSQNKTLKKLNLASCKLGDEGTKILASGLFKLDELCLYDNEVGNEGAIAFVEHPLKKLNLAENRITHDGAVALFQSNTLAELNLALNDIEGELTDLTLAIQRGIILDLDCNPINNVFLRAFGNKPPSSMITNDFPPEELFIQDKFLNKK